MKSITSVVILVLFLFFLCISTNAKTLLEVKTDEEIYNLNDPIGFDLVVLTTEAVEGFIRVLLICNNETFPVFVNFDKIEDRKEISFYFNAFKKGKCFLKGEILNQEYKTIFSALSNEFVVSDVLRINFSSNYVKIEPLETIIVSGNVSYITGKPFFGSGKVICDGKKFDVNISGNFSFQIVASGIGNKSCRIFVSDGKNEGENSYFFYVKEIVGSVDVNVSPNSTIEENITIIPIVLNQINESFSKSLNLSFKISKRKEKLRQGVVERGKKIIFETKGKEPGIYSVELCYQDICKTKNFEIQRFEMIDVFVSNNTLHFRNLGNVPYVDTITIVMVGENETVNKTVKLHLDVGEEKVVKLEGPKDEYFVEVITKKKNFDLGKLIVGSKITGKAVLLEKEGRFEMRWILLAIFLCGVLLFAFFIWKKFKKKRVVAVKIKRPRPSLPKDFFIGFEKKQSF